MYDKHQGVKGEKGQSLVELAISFIFILTIMGGVFDLGSMFYSYLSLRDTAQEGVTYGAINPTDQNGIVDRINASANWPIDADQITNIEIRCCTDSTTGPCTTGTCTTTTIESCQGQKITVGVEYNYELIMPVIGTFTGWQDIPLRSAVTYTILESKPTTSALELLGLTCPQ